MNDPNASSESVRNAEMFFNEYSRQINGLQENIHFQIKSTLETIIDIINSDKKNEFIESIYNIKKNLSDFLSTLELEQLLAVSNLLISILFFYLTINIILIYFGDFLIKYLNLEEKFPKLVRLINIRRKVINISMIYNTTVMLILSILLISVNGSYLLH